MGRKRRAFSTKFKEEAIHRAGERRGRGIAPTVIAREHEPFGILAHCRYPMHTSVLEGINNKITVLKRMA